MTIRTQTDSDINKAKEHVKEATRLLGRVVADQDELLAYDKERRGVLKETFVELMDIRDRLRG